MSKLNTIPLRFVVLCLATSTAIVFASVARAQDTDCSVVLERTGELQVAHCKQCGETNVSGTEPPILLPGAFRLPDFATDATVFQNGWQLNYLGDAHKITGVLAAIQNIRRRERELLWDSVGVLRDQNFDNAYRFCSVYTVLAWHDDTVRMDVNHSDSDDFPTFRADGRVENEQGDGSALTHLHLFRGHPATPVTLPQPTAAVLPRGFQFFFNSEDLGCFDPAGDPFVSPNCKDDNDILQIAFHKDHAEGFLPWDAPDNATGLSRVDTQVVGWSTYGIIKDNDDRRDYGFAVAASTLGGPDVGVIEPPFAIRPRDNARTLSPSQCVSSGQGVVTTEVVIENVPFRTAVPVLAGWDIRYVCQDDDVKEVGVWIDSFDYRLDPLPHNSVGTLRYRISRVLRDKSDSEQHRFDHSVDILGIGPLFTRLSPGDGVVAPVQP
jgi:hypothetical protein